MSGSLIEIIITAAIIAGALAFIGRRMYRSAQGKSTGCGSCGGGGCESR